MRFSAALLFVTIIYSRLVACARLPSYKCPPVVLPGKTCWAINERTGVGKFYYGDTLKFHAWHISRTKFSNVPFAVVPAGDANRPTALSGVPLAWPELRLDRDEKPLSSMYYNGSASVCHLPRNESNVEGGIARKMTRELREIPGARFHIIDNRWAFKDNFPPEDEEPECPRPAGRAKPFYPALVATTQGAIGGSNSASGESEGAKTRPKPPAPAADRPVSGSSEPGVSEPPKPRISPVAVSQPPKWAAYGIWADFFKKHPLGHRPFIKPQTTPVSSKFKAA